MGVRPSKAHENITEMNHNHEEHLKELMILKKDAMNMLVCTSPISANYGIDLLNGANFASWKDSIKLTLGMTDLDYALRHEAPATLNSSSTTEQKLDYGKGAILDSNNAKIYQDSVEEQFKGSSKSHASTLILKMLTTKYVRESDVHELIMMMSDMANKLKGMNMEISDGFLEEERLKLEKLKYVHLTTSTSSKRKGTFVKGECSKVQKSKLSTNPNSRMSKVKPHCKFCHKKGHWQRDYLKFKDWLTKKGDHLFMIFGSHNINIPSNICL
ncbi:hypothetical protein E3N88_13949 [Mikania micrantha]|uniref:Uncharacterized protein n=1 Tax=Mikania micrantha TaxID=192012 RepID=A0A5N6P021_9ASTR|nr:hypothetical protein E3N88_13949 [Mikania micrantha]